MPKFLVGFGVVRNAHVGALSQPEPGWSVSIMGQYCAQRRNSRVTDGRLALLHKLMFLLSGGGILILSVVLLSPLHSWNAVPADLAQPHRLMHACLVTLFGR